MQTKITPSRLDSTKEFSSLVPSAFGQANAAFIKANSAFTQANTPSLTANLAYAHANAAFTQANTGSIDSWVRTQANNAYDTANAAFTAANNSTDTWVRTQANSAFNTANSSGLFANGAFVTANSAASFANGAFAHANAAYVAANNSTDPWVRTQANNAYDKANSAGSFANGAFDQANSASSFANGSFVTANSAASFANGSFVTANSAAAFANAAFVTANSAASFANGAFSAANTKLNTSGGTITGDLSVTGNLTILGTETIINTTQLELTDTLIYLGSNNYTSDVVDIGIIGNYNPGTNAHTGIIRSATDKDWYLFQGYTPEVQSNNTIDLNHASFSIATLNANLKSTTITIKNIDLLPYVNSVYDKANSGASFANGSFVTANSAASFANGSFDRANAAYAAANLSSGTYASSAYDKANSAGSFANGAFVTANASYVSQNTTASFANGAFDRANAAYNAANTATDTWVRTQANNAYDTANAAFTQANTGSSDSWARAQANAAFEAANTSSSNSTLTGYVDVFTGDGSNSSFTLSTTPSGENITFVAIQGVIQPKSSYSLSGSTLTFDSIPPNTAYIEVTTLAATSIVASSGSLVYRAYTGDNTATSFAVTSGVVANNLLVAENGILQRPITDYTISGANVVFASAPANGVDIQIRELISSSGGSSITWYIANANTTTVTSSGYFVDTTVGPITMTLPASATLGDTIRFNDLAGTFSANNLTIARNSHKIQGIAADLTVDVDQTSFGLVYSNTTYGWKVLEL